MDIKSASGSSAAAISKPLKIEGKANNRPATSSDEIVKFERPGKLSDSDVREKLNAQKKDVEGYQQAAAAIKAKKMAASDVSKEAGKEVAKDATQDVAKDVAKDAPKDIPKDASKEAVKDAVKSDVAANNPSDPETIGKLKSLLKSGPSLFNDQEQKTLKTLLDA